MAKIEREDKGDLSAVIQLTLEPADYQPKFNAELNKHRKNAQMKGFRKGKTPLGLIKKMYGQSILVEVVNDMLQKKLTDYITEEKLNILGQPIPAEDQQRFDFDVNNMQDFVFRFEVGMAPEFEIKGLDKQTVFPRHAVEVPDATIDKDLDAARKRLGKRVSVEGPVEEGDMVEFNVEELDGDQLKENGWASTFSLLANDIADASVKEQVMGKKKGEKIRMNLSQLENRDEEYIRKYYLNVEENDSEVEIGDSFEGKISDILRMELAELDQEFFDKAFGEGTVNSESEARDKVRSEIASYYDKQAEALLFRDFQDRLIEMNDVAVPEGFLKKWLKQTNEKATDEEIENGFEDFIKNLRWTLVRGKLVERFKLEVKEEEIFENLKDQIRGYFGGYGDELIILNTANRLMEDRQQVERVYNNLMADKLFDVIKEEVGIEDKKTSVEEFEKVIEEARAATQAAPAVAQTTADESDSEAEEVIEDVEQ